MNVPPAGPLQKRRYSPDGAPPLMVDDTLIQSRISDLISRLHTEVGQFPGGKTGAERREFQLELSRLINLLQITQKQLIAISEKSVNLPYSRQKQLEINLDYIQIALDSLLRDQPNLTLARKIRRNIEYSVFASDNSIKGFLKNVFLRLIHLSSTPTKVVCGLALTLPLYLGAIYVSANNLTQTSTAAIAPASPSTAQPSAIASPSNPEINLSSLLVLVGSAGALGSIISMLTRIEAYRDKDVEDSLLPLLIGIFKPLIGVSFGILLLAISYSAVSPLHGSEDKFPPNTTAFTFFSLAFLAGFSERLAKDIVSQGEESQTT